MNERTDLPVYIAELEKAASMFSMDPAALLLVLEEKPEFKALEPELRRRFIVNLTPKKKRPVFANEAAQRILSKLSKSTLLDMVWTLALLGTNETEDEIVTKICREIEIVTKARGDRCSPEIRKLASRPIDSDPS